MAWSALARVVFLAAVAYAAALFRPLLLNLVFAVGLAGLVVLLESRLRQTAVTQVLAAPIGCAIGLGLARAIDAGPFWADTDGRRAEFLHSFILIVLPYLGLVMISKTIEIGVTSVLQTTAGKMIFGRHIELGMSAPHAVERDRPWPVQAQSS